MVKPKKHLGQHFLTDMHAAEKIVDALPVSVGNVLEIGPGTGVLTKLLIKKSNLNFKVVELDSESVAYLIENSILEQNKIIEKDFLKLNLGELFQNEQFAIIGNFPYNISSQILFKAVENRPLVNSLTGMFQKEVAERVVASPGGKDYGILSVLMQAYFTVEYLFTVKPGSFVPAPKVQSGVIRLVRKQFDSFGCDEVFFKAIVKQSFNTRRKMLRGSLRSFIKDNELLSDAFFEKRPEQLSLDEFKYLTNILQNQRNESKN